MAVDRAELLRRRLENLIRAGLLLGALALLAGLAGFVLAGWTGLIWTGVLAATGAWLMTHLPAQLVLRQTGAVPIAYWQEAVPPAPQREPAAGGIEIPVRRRQR